jgi:hypothetical protein
MYIVAWMLRKPYWDILAQTGIKSLLNIGRTISSHKLKNTKSMQGTSTHPHPKEKHIRTLTDRPRIPAPHPAWQTS